MMSGNLVTVATFSTPMEAGMAQSRLELEGIQVFQTDAATVSMAWHFGIMVGGIKLQVIEDDLERALVALESNDSAVITEDDWRSDESDDEPEEDDAEYQVASPADEMVALALHTAVLGFVIPGFQLYSLWLLARIAKNAAPLTSANRRRVLLTCIADLPTILICCVLIKELFWKNSC
jgi:hypothetical protein